MDKLNGELKIDHVHRTLVAEFYPITKKQCAFLGWKVRGAMHCSNPTIKGGFSPDGKFDQDWFKIEFISDDPHACQHYLDHLAREYGEFLRNTSSPRKPHKRPGRAAKLARKQRADARKEKNHE